MAHSIHYVTKTPFVVVLRHFGVGGCDRFASQKQTTPWCEPWEFWPYPGSLSNSKTGEISTTTKCWTLNRTYSLQRCANAWEWCDDRGKLFGFGEGLLGEKLLCSRVDWFELGTSAIGLHLGQLTCSLFFRSCCCVVFCTCRLRFACVFTLFPRMQI